MWTFVEALIRQILKRLGILYIHLFILFIILCWKGLLIKRRRRVEFDEKLVIQGVAVNKWKWVVKFSKICNLPSSNIYNYPTESRGRRKNLPGQLSGYWTLQEKEVHRIMLNVANEGLFWNTSILFVNISKAHF